jgi:glycine C-acetyltransferase
MYSLDPALVAELQALKENPLFNKPGILYGSSAGRAVINGKDVIILCSNNYHALTIHPKVISRVKEALDQYGSGLGSGRALASMKIQLDLEEKLSDFKQTGATLTFQTGYDTNLATVWALTDEADVCVCDEFNHASVFDGLKLSRAKVEVYPHLNLHRLEESLKKSRGARRIFVITPSVFPLEGDIAPLPEIVKLAEKYSAIVYMDDSHAVGVLGKKGAGIVEHFGLHSKVEIQVGTFSKALASVGGYVTGSPELREYLFRKARPFSQATGHIAPPSAAAAIAAIEVLQEDASLLERLWSNAKYFRESIKALGFDTGKSETPIVPILIGDERTTAQFRDLLFEEKVYVQGFGFPALPKGKAKLRTIVSSAHTREDLDFCLSAFEKVGKKLGVI